MLTSHLSDPQQKKDREFEVVVEEGALREAGGTEAEVLGMTREDKIEVKVKGERRPVLQNHHEVIFSQ